MGDVLQDTFCSLLGVTSNAVFKVEDLEKLYIRVSTLAAAAAKSLDKDLFARARIRVVQLRKQRSTSEHEYILVYITLDGLPTDCAIFGIIKCERTVHEQHRNKPRSRGFLGGISSLSSNPSSFLSMKAVPAFDRFIIYDPNDLPTELSLDQLVYHYDFPASCAPPPTRLFAAASTLHRSFPKYILLHRQCYWFGGMLFRMLVGSDADELKATPESQDVQLSIAYSPDSLRSAGREDTETTTYDQPRAIGVSGGTFKSIFTLVTKDDIEKCYTAVENTFSARLAQMDWQLAQAREKNRQRLAESDEQDLKLVAFYVELEELRAQPRSVRLGQSSRC